MVGHRPRSERFGIADANAASVEKAFEQDPTKFLRVASAKLETPLSATRNFLHDKLGIFPFKMSFRQQLLPENCSRRLTFAHDVLL